MLQLSSGIVKKDYHKKNEGISTIANDNKNTLLPFFNYHSLMLELSATWPLTK